MTDDDELESLIAYVRDERGFDFSGYKRTSLGRRVRKRMDELGIAEFGAYRERLEQGGEEFHELFNTILINVSSFFRDPETWEEVAASVVPAIVERSGPDPIRVWTAGCATGEEAYTVAMMFCDALGEKEFADRVKIYATDVDREALEFARRGRFRQQDLAEQLSSDQIERYFEHDGEQHGTFRKELRRSIIFGRHDLMTDAPISRLDLLTCRNTLMYFTSGGQARVLDQLGFALRPQGFLVLGRSETLASRSDRFVVLDLKRRIFRLNPDTPTRARLTQPVGRVIRDDGVVSDTSQDTLAGFEASAIAQLLVGTGGEMSAVNHQARLLFALNRDDVGRPLQDLEVSYRPLELRSRVETVADERRALVEHGVQIVRADGARTYDVVFSPLTSATGVDVGVSVSFIETTALEHARIELERFRNELQTAYEELQSTVEELETTNEELQSTNEELETTNEELQSTNEELETMNEELQSTNEELETTNDELRIRTDELNEVNAFLEAILASFQSAVIVVDRDMKVLVWNDQSYEMWGLRASEVVGAHLMNLDIGLPLEQLRQPVLGVLSGQGAAELTVTALNRRGREMTCHVTASALWDADGGVLGVIILIDDAEPPA